MNNRAYYTPGEEKEMQRQLDEIFRVSYQKINKKDKELIQKAFETAKEAHREQRRKSGEAYMFHPLAVAKIVAERIGLGATSIAAALLHDTVEDTELTVDDIRRDFGDKIAQIVEGLTKIKNIPMGQSDTDTSLQAENFRKLILTLNEDVRVILIKIADRLHNLQTLESMAPHKQQKIASETLYIYAPLAHRFGLYDIKTELEDLSLKYLEPEIYNEIVRKLKETKEQREKYIKKFTDIVKEELKPLKIKFTVTGRPKSIYSIYKKMKTKKVEFEEIYDILAIRIVYKGHPNVSIDRSIAWNIMSLLVHRFKHNPDRMRNWLEMPRSTGYEALHITVLGPENKWVEVQIRSERMNEIAEKGYAAHYKYKQGHDEGQELGIERWLNQLQEILNEPVENTSELLDDIRLNLYSEEINVLTPKGDVISLPKGATVLDFAFHIHTDIGMHTRAARVNGRIVPLNYVLNSGDVVEIITSNQQTPKHAWLNLTITGRARSKIKAYLRQKENQIVNEGKEILQRKLRHLKREFNEKTLNELQKYFKLKTSRDLFYKVGIGEISNEQLKAFVKSQNSVLRKLLKTPWPKRKPQPPVAPPRPDEGAPNYDMIVFGPDEQRLDYTLANCCNPLPGDDIFGFITINEGIKVHKKNCPNAIYLQSRYAHRIIPAMWIDSSKQEFKVRLQITGADRPGIVADITDLIARRLGYKMRHVEFDDQNGVFKGNITVYLQNTNQLKDLTLQLKQIEGVEDVKKL